MPAMRPPYRAPPAWKGPRARAGRATSPRPPEPRLAARVMTRMICSTRSERMRGRSAGGRWCPAAGSSAVPLFPHPGKRVQHTLHFAERQGAHQGTVRPWNFRQVRSNGAIADGGAIADCGRWANHARLSIRRQLLSEYVHDASLYIGRVFGNNTL